jgi:ribonuclease D
MRVTHIVLKGRSIIQYIDRQPALDQCVETIGAESTWYVDTEFLRERTYHPKLCLLQVRAAGDIWLIDPLASLDLDPLWLALTAPLCILHSGRQDMEVLRLEAGRLPTRVFDTQVAASLLGYPAQIGYGRLVEELCGVSLDKTHTRTDWTRRPLHADVLEYAADDVRFLPELHDKLAARLAENGRQAWAEEDSAALLDPVLYEVDVAEAWRRVKGAGRIRGAAQQRLSALAAWREQRALDADRPRQWILKDDVLIAIALADPQTLDDLDSIQGLGDKLVARHGPRLLDALHATLPAARAASGPPDEQERARVKRMAAAVRKIAESLGIEPEVIAPRRELARAAAGQADIRALSGWRDDVCGDAIRALMP